MFQQKFAVPDTGARTDVLPNKLTLVDNFQKVHSGEGIVKMANCCDASLRELSWKKSQLLLFFDYEKDF